MQLLPQEVCNLEIIAHFSIGKTLYKINKYMISTVIGEQGFHFHHTNGFIGFSSHCTLQIQGGINILSMFTKTFT